MKLTGTLNLDEAAMRELVQVGIIEKLLLSVARDAITVTGVCSPGTGKFVVEFVSDQET